jgi:hypothetical protein
MPPKQHRRPSTSKAEPANLITAKRLRVNTAYGNGRTIVFGTACLNGIIQPLGLWFLLDGYELPVKVVACLSTLLFWILFDQVGRAFFDMADSNLDLTRRYQAADPEN